MEVIPTMDPPPIFLQRRPATSLFLYF
jgi:hypothetical protein